MNNTIKIDESVKTNMIERLYIFWKDFLKYQKIDKSSKELLKEITDNINNGLNGIEQELDNIRIANEDISEDHLYFQDFQDLWNITNWYKDYLDNRMSLKEIKKLLGISEDLELDKKINI